MTTWLVQNVLTWLGQNVLTTLVQIVLTNNKNKYIKFCALAGPTNIKI